MKILNSISKNFDKNLDSLLLKRKRKVQSNSVSVSSIIKDVRKNGDKAVHVIGATKANVKALGSEIIDIE